MAVFLHLRWYTVDKVFGAEALSGFGSTLVVLGILLASRPYLRAGIGRLVYDSFSAIGLYSYPGDDVVRQQLNRIRSNDRRSSLISGPSAWSPSSSWSLAPC